MKSADVDIDEGLLGVSDEETSTPGQNMARIVPPNEKCNGCLHYDTARTACMIGEAPMICGDGSEPEVGYAPVIGSDAQVQMWRQKMGYRYNVQPAQLPDMDPPVGPAYAVQVLGDSAITLSMAESSFRKAVNSSLKNQLILSKCDTGGMGKVKAGSFKVSKKKGSHKLTFKSLENAEIVSIGNYPSYEHAIGAALAFEKKVEKAGYVPLSTAEMHERHAVHAAIPGRNGNPSAPSSMRGSRTTPAKPSNVRHTQGNGIKQKIHSAICGKSLNTDDDAELIPEDLERDLKTTTYKNKKQKKYFKKSDDMYIVKDMHGPSPKLQGQGGKLVTPKQPGPSISPVLKQVRQRAMNQPSAESQKKAKVAGGGSKFSHDKLATAAGVHPNKIADMALHSRHSSDFVNNVRSAHGDKVKNLTSGQIRSAYHGLGLEHSLKNEFRKSAFDKLANKLAHKKGVTDPRALAAKIGRKKLGEKEMERRSEAARKSEAEMELEEMLLKSQKQLDPGSKAKKIPLPGTHGGGEKGPKQHVKIPGGTQGPMDRVGTTAKHVTNKEKLKMPLKAKKSEGMEEFDDMLEKAQVGGLKKPPIAPSGARLGKEKLGGIRQRMKAKITPDPMKPKPPMMKSVKGKISRKGALSSARPKTLSLKASHGMYHIDHSPSGHQVTYQSHKGHSAQLGIFNTRDHAREKMDMHSAMMSRRSNLGSTKKSENGALTHGDMDCVKSFADKKRSAIGHTSKGKPVYNDSSNANTFDIEEHGEAADMHNGVANRISDASYSYNGNGSVGPTAKKYLREASEHHRHQARRHEKTISEHDQKNMPKQEEVASFGKSLSLSLDPTDAEIASAIGYSGGLVGFSRGGMVGNGFLHSGLPEGGEQFKPQQTQPAAEVKRHPMDVIGGSQSMADDLYRFRS